MSELEFWKDLGNIFDSVMNYQKKNVEFNNRFINPWIRLGNVFERQDQANDAVQAYQRATEIDPDTAQNWIELGDAQFKKGEYDQAIEAYGKAVILDPKAGWPLGNLALSMVTQGKVEEAIPLYIKSIELLTEVKDKAICWNRLGNAYRKLNDYENAFLAFQKADRLDGDNTGFSDKLDETPLSMPLVAPEEILEKMIVDQNGAEGETEFATSEVANEVVEEIGQPEDGLVIAETTGTAQVESCEELATLKPDEETAGEERTIEEESVLPLNETSVKQFPNANTATEEQTPLALHETKLDLIQIVENVIAKVERAYADHKNSNSNEEQESGKASAAIEISNVQEEMAQEIEVENVVSEEASQEIEVMNAASEEAAQEVEVVNAVSEEAVQEVESVAATDEDVIPEFETISTSEKISGEEEVETPTTQEETSTEIEVVAAEISVDAEPEIEALVVNEVKEEKVSEDAPQRIPEWLVMKNVTQAKAKASCSETKEQHEPAQVESIATLSNISQEVAISESTVNMDIVETYTDQLDTQLTTEPHLGDMLPDEATDQAESPAEVESKEIPATEASNPAEESMPSAESSVDVIEEQVTELAYEEYLKDVSESVKILKDHVDEIQSEAPVTKVSKNGEVRIAMDTKNAHVWNELGNIYLNAGTCDDAIASYSKAIELDRNFAWPYSNLALAYVQKGRFAEAILLYQRGIELFTSDRDKAITWNRLGNVYRRINDYSNAIASYQTADELDPENATLSLRSSFGLLGNMYSDAKPAYAA